jgi:tRNA(fMet)-specific endonuclease VapC
MILLDTSVLVEHFRKKDKTSTSFYKLSEQDDDFAISTITHYEILSGSNDLQDTFWEGLFNTLTILPFDVSCSTESARIYKSLKPKGLLIDLADLTIAATAIAHRLSLATLNTKHFSRVKGLRLVDLVGL